ncbi:hypothetical protein IV203_031268 [Nitzschia inconspicua]|uniref:Uncharacterized protein n=1 Tax=Nitzschia inconspicua TaxID=303405 RepID=A0A9K3LTX8_9STRA|nr:hypothetical protein IV203_031268 [Nitzschia inconspicua]
MKSGASSWKVRTFTQETPSHPRYNAQTPSLKGCIGSTSKEGGRETISESNCWIRQQNALKALDKLGHPPFLHLNPLLHHMSSDRQENSYDQKVTVTDQWTTYLWLSPDCAGL